MPHQYGVSAPGLHLPRGRDYWTDPDYTNPLYSPGDIAKHFFGFTVRWLTMHRSEHGIDDARLAPSGVVRIQTANGQHPWRRYNLHHIEKLAHEFMAVRVIDAERFVASVSIVKATAVLRGYGPRIRAIEDAYVREQEESERGVG